MNNCFEVILKNKILKAPIKVIYGENNFSEYSYNQTLEEIENDDMECEIIKSIEDKSFIYEKVADSWFRKRR